MKTKKIALYGLLTAVALLLSYLEAQLPAFVAIPGIKLGLANMVLLYGVYMLDWKSCVALMLTKVLLSGFLFGSLSAILYSLAGGALSLMVMLLIKRRPDWGALAIAVLAALSDAALLWRNSHPGGQLLWCVILIALACVAAAAVFVFIRRNPENGVLGTSLAGAVAHNVGQMLAAVAVLHTPQLLYTYLPVLVGIGAAVGALTGFVARRVFAALKIRTENGN